MATTKHHGHQYDMWCSALHFNDIGSSVPRFGDGKVMESVANSPNGPSRARPERSVKGAKWAMSIEKNHGEFQQIWSSILVFLVQC